MFELVYKHPFTDKREKITSEKKVSYSSLGVFYQITHASMMLIPWNRVLSITGPNERMKMLAEYTAFGE